MSGRCGLWSLIMQRLWPVLLVFLLPGIVDAKSIRINARSAILIDALIGNTFFEQNAGAPIQPASITKVLTLYIVFDAIRDGEVHLQDQVLISKVAAMTGGSRMDLRAGKKVSLEDLIKGMAVFSGNDAAVAVAEHLCGNVSAFVARMNAKASQLGMRDSRFVNPHGLPAEGQVTTARDMAKLCRAYLMSHPEALRIHSLPYYTYNKVKQHNRNRLLGKCAGVDGIKTGFVCAAGYHLAATAKRGDIRLIAVIMGAQNPSVRTTETRKLIEEGFRRAAAGLPKMAKTLTIGEASSEEGPSSAKDDRTARKAPTFEKMPEDHGSREASAQPAGRQKGVTRATMCSVAGGQQAGSPSTGQNIAAQQSKAQPHCPDPPLDGYPLEDRFEGINF